VGRIKGQAEYPDLCSENHSNNFKKIRKQVPSREGNTKPPNTPKQNSALKRIFWQGKSGIRGRKGNRKTFPTDDS